MVENACAVLARRVYNVRHYVRVVVAIHCLSPVMVELPSLFVASSCEIVHW